MTGYPPPADLPVQVLIGLTLTSPVGGNPGEEACNLARATEAILDLFSELRTEAVAAGELEHILSSYRFDLDYSRDQVDEMALRYAQAQIDAGADLIGIGDAAASLIICRISLQTNWRWKTERF